MGINSGELLRRNWSEFRGAARRVNEAFIEADYGGESFVKRERRVCEYRRGYLSTSTRASCAREAVAPV